MNKEIANSYFPLWKVEFIEGVYGRDSGSPWADPENDVRRYQEVRYLSKKDVDSEFELEYRERTGKAAYGLSQAVITLDKLKMIQGLYPPDIKTAMFSYQGSMFSYKHFDYQEKCIYGECIDGSYNFGEDNSVCVDVVKGHVVCYDEDCIVMYNGKYYFNNALIGTAETINVDYESAQMMYPESVRQEFLKMFPSAKTYKSDIASGSMI